MSVSTDAILFYGYTFDPEDDDTGEAVTAVVEKADEDYDWSKTIGNAYGVILGRHGSAEYPMPYLAIEESETQAARGYPERIDPHALAWGRGLDERLRAAAEAYGLSIEGKEPSWWLVSYWG